MTVDKKVYQAARLIVPYWLPDAATPEQIDDAAQKLAEVMQEYLQDEYPDDV